MKQQTLAMAADHGFERHRKPTRCDVFLERMNRIIPCMHCAWSSSRIIRRRGMGCRRLGWSACCAFISCSTGSTWRIWRTRKRSTTVPACDALPASTWAASRCRMRPHCSNSAACWNSTSRPSVCLQKWAVYCRLPDGQRGTGEDGGLAHSHVRRRYQGWTIRHRMREATARDAAVGALQCALGAAADGADAVQHAVSLFRWFVGLSMDDTVWVPTVLTKNRERLAEHDAIIAFFNEVVTMADEKGVIGRTPQRGRHAHWSLGRPQELRAQGGGRPRRQRDDDGDFKGQPAATRSMHRRPIRMRGCIVRARPPANCDSWDIPQATIKQLVWRPANKQSAAAVDKRGL